MLTFKQVHAKELETLRAARAGSATSEDMIGLAFSGGGIRSATFNLGIIQGMARLGLLKHFDYLSTVSGGGYIGSWYMGVLKRLAGGSPKQAEDLLNPDRQAGPLVEPAAVLWLRRFSNYLTPKTGLSGDTLTLAATYVRNFLLNVTVILAFLGSLLLLPRIISSLVPRLDSFSLLPQLVGAPLLFAVLAMMFLVLRMQAARPGTTPFPHNQVGVVTLVVLPLLFAALTLSLGLNSPGYGDWAWRMARLLTSHMLDWGLPQAWLNAFAVHIPHWDSWLIAQAIATFAYLVPWALGSVIVMAATLLRDAKRDKAERDLPSRAWQALRHAVAMFAAAIIASLVAGVLVGALAEAAVRLDPRHHELIVFGPPLVILAFAKPVLIHVGLARRHFTEMQREWWARLGGWLIAVSLAWLFITGIALYGPYLMGRLNHWLLAGGGLAWLGTTGWGLVAAKGAKTGDPGAGGLREKLLVLVPWIFVLGLLGLVSLGLQKGLASPPAPSPAIVAATAPDQIVPAALAPAAARNGRDRIAASLEAVPGRQAVYAFIALGAVFLFLGWRIDINLFSFHNFYRNRLTRCYQGASRSCWPEDGPGDCRRPNPFTGFDPRDDLALAGLPTRPYPLYNTALNLVGGHELAWQQRKAASFTFSPLFCGYELPEGMGRGRGGYRETGCFLAGELKGEYRDEPKGERGARLGTAVAVSGAAVNPNMGYHSSPAVSFLLTVFNVRLGRWVPNPARGEGVWRQTSPRFGVLYMFMELFSLTSQDRKWFNLSDGGHFENLGIYELVRRRLPYIVCVDAAEDVAYHFDDLANAIRKIRADLGIDIDIDLAALRPGPDGRQKAHAAIGLIHYEQAVPGARPGVLVYLRPGLTGNEPADVLSYAKQNPPFPFQTTVDQFFDEAQFESYRKLGLHVAESVLGEAAERLNQSYADHGEDNPGMAENRFNPESFFTVLREAWRGRLSIDDGINGNLHQRLDALFERLRTDPDLAFLSAEFFPEWPDLMGKPGSAMELPAYEAQRKAGFYLCREIAQFMERAYQDLDLDSNHDHPDCRGWMNLFRHWSWSPMFRATYAITAATLSEPFQRFCKRRLGLDLGEVELRCTSLDEAGLSGLNFVERGMVERMAPEPWLAGQGDSARLVLFELVIRYPGEKDTTVELLRFHFGFALLVANVIAGFRVQDHLRRMGLARRAMARLAEEIPGLGLISEPLGDEGMKTLSASHEGVLRRLHDSVLAIRASEQRARAAGRKPGKQAGHWEDE